MRVYSDPFQRIGDYLEMITLLAVNRSLDYRREKFIFTVNGWEEAGAEVVVEILVTAHLVDFLPLSFTHLFLDGLSCNFLISVHLAAKLKYNNKHIE